jgi:hypothetical protein
MAWNEIRFAILSIKAGLPDLFSTTYQNGKMYQMTMKYIKMATKNAKWQETAPNGHKNYQMAER